ncbi:MAG: hypothetical protein IJ593_05255 [Lachnospiraceae bacterium]|nr:hypothetical protein [Lachnospiraceae bacterium]
MTNPNEVCFSTNIKLNKNRDSAVIDRIKKMTSSGNWGVFLSTLVRATFENPEIAVKNEDAINEIIKYGGTPVMKEFYAEKTREVKEMHSKIDKIYDMCLDMYTMSKFGKTQGFDKKLDNMATAQFIAERQLKELTETLGILDLSPYESTKKDIMIDKAEQALELIITRYSDIVTEIKNSGISVVKSSNNDIKVDASEIGSGEVIDLEPSKKDDTESKEDAEASMMLNSIIAKLGRS